MCILFFQLNDREECGAYRLVLANNRDEYWTRPTSTAAYWGEKDNCLSSLDQKPGREGGIWLGINKQGKIGVLLNILEEHLPNRKGRGFLARDFIASDTCAETFLQDLSKDLVTSQYNGFHLVLLEAGGPHPLAMYLTESSVEERRMQRLPLGDPHAFGNSAVDRPWQKIEQGRPRFQKIIEENRSPEAKNKLVDSLMDFLNDKGQYTADSVLGAKCQDLGIPTHIRDERSANGVWSPSIVCGTRTNTVILVDSNGRCDYIERSLVTPVKQEDPQTTTKTFSFHIDLTSI
ncbi:transport and Golgi organization 2 homolog isoform X1 [Haliotis rufescens]|uniref:transport and Golgi organization 2 homolog isoform X1 n=1 Tax=Haliotis rufescens TaxID=6454 RepID=UPI00201EF99E|nr:transport and Golgi organization 2 homolog isoform X1 [Haliotis rufescens]